MRDSFVQQPELPAPVPHMAGDSEPFTYMGMLTIISIMFKNLRIVYLLGCNIIVFVNYTTKSILSILVHVHMISHIHPANPLTQLQ